MKPVNAIKKASIPKMEIQGISQKDFPRNASVSQPILGSNVTIRYLYEPGELESGKKRATDPIWSVTAHKISTITRSTGRPAIYKLDSTAPQRGFTRQQLQIIPEDTQLPPHGLN